ncbi:hypothetical protein GCM10027360_59650 [Amycolatopsis echigonensis]
MMLPTAAAPTARRIVASSVTVAPPDGPLPSAASVTSLPSRFQDSLRRAPAITYRERVKA